MNQSIKLNKKQAAPLVSKTFPHYNGRKFKLEFSDKVTFYDTNWSDGTRQQYCFVNADGRTLQFTAPAPWVNPVEGMTAPIPPDVMVVIHSIFCGTDCGITIIAHPSHAPAWLDAPKGN